MQAPLSDRETGSKKAIAQRSQDRVGVRGEEGSHGADLRAGSPIVNKVDEWFTRS
jgi:hypothetical protein